MHIKMVFSDVDGTLLTSHHQLLPSSKEAIRSLQEKKIPFVIISGRSPEGLYPILNKYQFKCPLVCYGGSLILDEDKKVLYNAGFSLDIALEVCQFIKENKLALQIFLYSKEGWFVENKNHPLVIEEEQIVEAKSTECDFKDLNKDTLVNKLLLVHDHTKMHDEIKILKEAFPSFDFMQSLDYLIEVVLPTEGKGKAVERLAKIHGIKVEDVMCFGDGFNDLDMLAICGYPVLMNNAPVELKKRNYHLTESNDQDGIYNELKRARVI